MPHPRAQDRDQTMAYTFVDDLPCERSLTKGRVASSPKQSAQKLVENEYLPPRGAYARIGKRIFDVTLVLAMLPIILPVLAVVWFITALDGGRAIYSQERVGKGGRIFKCWKIRTMVPNAESALERLIKSDPAVAAEWQANQKLANDPRITRWGRVLRKTSIDELPQLFNVLTGDMSLIGPRPFTPAQKTMYDACPNAIAYYHLRPGISGLWQVDCRNSGTFGGRAGYDMSYAKSLSFAGDVKIALRTVAVVLRATGK